MMERRKPSYPLNMKCPTCSAAKLVHDTRDMPYTYKGESTILPLVTGDFWLDQREAAQIFGGGINAFSRYENGKTKPPLSLVKLLKVLDRHPELLNEIKVA